MYLAQRRQRRQVEVQDEVEGRRSKFDVRRWEREQIFSRKERKGRQVRRSIYRDRPLRTWRAWRENVRSSTFDVEKRSKGRIFSRNGGQVEVKAEVEEFVNSER
jgi:hypothetical protein